MLLYVHLHIFPVWLEIQVLAVQKWLHHTPVSWRLCEVAHSLETRHPGWKGPLITGRDLGNSEASPGSQRSRPCWETRNISIRKKTLQTMALRKYSQEGFGGVFSLFFYLFIHLLYLFCAVPKPVKHCLLRLHNQKRESRAKDGWHGNPLANPFHSTLPQFLVSA